ncbi:hypothetical protein GW17_00045668 [Ensete ventricosum]|nr:hypothetical protein GW17_00045668 [Ensete ventricosum]
MGGIHLSLFLHVKAGLRVACPPASPAERQRPCASNGLDHRHTATLVLADAKVSRALSCEPWFCRVKRPWFWDWISDVTQRLGAHSTAV